MTSLELNRRLYYLDGWVDKCVHFGIHGDSKSKSDHTKTIDERIQCVGGAPTLSWVHTVYMGKVGLIIWIPPQCTPFYIALFPVGSWYFEF